MSAEDLKTVDSEGNEFKQKPFDITDVPKPKARPKSARTVKVISIYNAKQFLSDGTIDYLEEKRILESDYRMLDKIGGRVKKIL